MLASHAAPASPRPLPPSLPARGLLGHLPQMGRDPLDLVMKARREVGEIARLRMAHRDIVFAFDPVAVRRVLVENPSNYAKQTRGYEKLRLVLPNFLVCSRDFLVEPSDLFLERNPVGMSRVDKVLGIRLAPEDLVFGPFASRFEEPILSKGHPRAPWVEEGSVVGIEAIFDLVGDRGSVSMRLPYLLRDFVLVPDEMGDAPIVRPLEPNLFS